VSFHARLYVELLQVGLCCAELFGSQLLSSPFGWHLQRQVPVCGAVGAHLRREVDGQGADDGVARLHLGWV